jgi:beta-mannosidase
MPAVPPPSGAVGAVLAEWRVTSTPPGAAADPAALDARAPAWTRAEVPGTAAAALRAAGAWSLDGPARRFDAEDWWYRCVFAAAAEEREGPWRLELDGLASVADVWCNGRPVLRSENMFVAHRVALREPLLPTNQIDVRFAALDGLLSARRPRPRWRAPMVEHQQLRWLRTTLLGRTPGWSPPTAAVGPWRPIRLRRPAPVEVEAWTARPRIEGPDGVLELTATLTVPALVSAARLTLERASGPLSCPLTIEPVVPPQGSDRQEAPFGGARSVRVGGALRVPEVEPWWPHTHGAQPLHQAALLVTIAGQELEVRRWRVGFRTLELDTRAGDFALTWNGARVFWRGACWTPLDPVTLSASPAQQRAALEAVRDAGMNMIRIGGTMVYEDDAFLDLCDELGIVVWQDFMFANLDYPEDEPFRASVRQEARQMLLRWQGRPSLGILCGDSEGEQQAAMWGAPRAAWERPLFRDVLPSLCRDLCPDVPYWPSSASGGSFPHQVDAGTTSYYGVGAYLRPFDDARRSGLRFASECLAFANIPDEPTLTVLAGGPAAIPPKAHAPLWKARVPRDLGAGWDFDDVRDHYLRELFGCDPVALRSFDHERYLALGRVTTGEVMARAFAEWRRGGSSCRGALVWFLRDLAPGPGWGVVDALGRPKAAWHYLRRALAPRTVFLTDEGQNGLYLHVVNERPTPLDGELRLALFLRGQAPVGAGARRVFVPPREALQIPAVALLEGFVDTSYAYRFGPPGHDLVVASLYGEDGGLVAQAFAFPVGLPRERHADLGLRAVVEEGAGEATLLLESPRFAQSVAIDAPGFAPADNYFHLAPGISRRVPLRRITAAGRPQGTASPLNADRATKF